MPNVRFYGPPASTVKADERLNRDLADYGIGMNHSSDVHLPWV